MSTAHRPLTAHLPSVENVEEAWDSAREVELLREHPGWDRFKESVDHKIASLQEQLVSSPKATPAEYERIIGEMRGLSQIDGLVAGLIQRGTQLPTEEVAA